MTSANGAHQPQPAVVGIPPSPVPLGWVFGLVDMASGAKMVMFRIDSPTGSFFAFLGPDDAKRFANDMRKIANQASSGLILP